MEKENATMLLYGNALVFIPCLHEFGELYWPNAHRARLCRRIEERAPTIRHGATLMQDRMPVNTFIERVRITWVRVILRHIRRLGAYDAAIRLKSPVL